MKGKPINQSFKLLLWTFFFRHDPFFFQPCGPCHEWLHDHVDDLRNRIQDLAMSPGGVMFWRGQLGNVFHRNSNWTDFCGKVLDSKDSLEIFGDLFHMFFCFYAFKSRSKSAGSLAVGACLSLLLDIGLISDFGRLKICHTLLTNRKSCEKKKTSEKKRVPKNGQPHLTIASPSRELPPAGRVGLRSSIQGCWNSQLGLRRTQARWGRDQMKAHWFPTVDRPWLSFFFWTPALIGTHFKGNQKNCKCMVILRDFPYNNALFGLVL